jgi:hypothetical protein
MSATRGFPTVTGITSQRSIYHNRLRFGLKILIISHISPCEWPFHNHRLQSQYSGLDSRISDFFPDWSRFEALARKDIYPTGPFIMLS